MEVSTKLTHLVFSSAANLKFEGILKTNFFAECSSFFSPVTLAEQLVCCLPVVWIPALLQGRDPGPCEMTVRCVTI